MLRRSLNRPFILPLDFERFPHNHSSHLHTRSFLTMEYALKVSDAVKSFRVRRCPQAPGECVC